MPTPVEYVCVYLSGRHVLVPQEFLNSSDVLTGLKQVRGK